MFAAIQKDRIEKGPIPAILLGDLNIELSDSQKLRQSLQSRYWCDTPDQSSFDMQSQPTCHEGKTGSQIDHIFVSASLYDLAFNFRVSKLAD